MDFSRVRNQVRLGANDYAHSMKVVMDASCHLPPIRAPTILCRLLCALPCLLFATLQVSVSCSAPSSRSCANVRIWIL